MNAKPRLEMSLAPDFQFSQGSLQDYVDCPRRFQLRYMLNVAWPAVESEPILAQERHMRQGAAFHRLIQQHITGLPVERLNQIAANLSADDPGGDLELWWNNFLAYHPADIPGRRYVELALSATVNGFATIARYDLLVIQPVEKITILDWKTNRSRPKKDWSLSRLQTRVYRYLAVRAAAHLNDGQVVRPEQVELIYWFAGHPEQPESLPYDTLQYQADEAYLANLVAEIAANHDAVFPLTSHEKECRLCRYRSLCERGVAAGDLNESQEEWEPDLISAPGFDFESATEIAF